MISLLVSPRATNQQVIESCQKAIQTLQTDVKQIRPVGSRSGRLRRGEQLFFRDAPLRAEGPVRSDFANDVDNRVGCDLDGRERGRLGSEEPVERRQIIFPWNER